MDSTNGLTFLAGGSTASSDDEALPELLLSYSDDEALYRCSAMCLKTSQTSCFKKAFNAIRFQ